MKRILSLILSLCMVLPLVPAVGVFAEEGGIASAQETAPFDYDSLYISGWYYKADFFDITPQTALPASSTSTVTGYGMKAGVSFYNTSASASAYFTSAAEVSAAKLSASGITVISDVPWVTKLNATQTAKVTDTNYTSVTEIPEGFTDYIDYSSDYKYYVPNSGATGEGELLYVCDSSLSAAYVYGISKDFYIQSNGLVTKTSIPLEGALRLGNNTALQLSNIGTAVISESYNLSGDATVELVSAINQVANGQAFMAAYNRITFGKNTQGNFRLTGVTNATISSADQDTGIAIGENPFHSAWSFDLDRSQAIMDFNLRVNGKQVLLSSSKEGGPTLSGIAPKESTDSYMKIGEGLDLSLYAIRVYPKVLTEAQLEQNRFADVAKYYGLELSAYLLLNEEDQDLIRKSMANYTLGQLTDEGVRDSESAQATLDALIQDLLFQKEYITNGLVAFFDASRYTEGATQDSVGTSMTATGTLSTDGKYLNNAVVTYLGATQKGDDYTVEMLAKFNSATTAKRALFLFGFDLHNIKYVGEGNMAWSSNYHANSSTWRVDGYQAPANSYWNGGVSGATTDFGLQPFVLSSQTKITEQVYTYENGSYGLPSGVTKEGGLTGAYGILHLDTYQSKTVSFPTIEAIKDKTYTFTDTNYRNKLETLINYSADLAADCADGEIKEAVENATFINFAETGNYSYDGVYHTKLTLNGTAVLDESVALVYFDENKDVCGADNGTRFRAGYVHATNQPTSPLDIAYFRIYDRVLEAWEQARNYTVDLLRYFDIALSFFPALSEEQKQSVDAAMAEISVTTADQATAEAAYRAALYDALQKENDATWSSFLALMQSCNIDLTSFLALREEQQASLAAMILEQYPTSITQAEMETMVQLGGALTGNTSYDSFVLRAQAANIDLTVFQSLPKPIREDLAESIVSENPNFTAEDIAAAILAWEPADTNYAAAYVQDDLVAFFDPASYAGDQKDAYGATITTISGSLSADGRYWENTALVYHSLLTKGEDYTVDLVARFPEASSTGTTFLFGLESNALKGGTSDASWSFTKNVIASIRMDGYKTPTPTAAYLSQSNSTDTKNVTKTVGTDPFRYISETTIVNDPVAAVNDTYPTFAADATPEERAGKFPVGTKYDTALTTGLYGVLHLSAYNSSKTTLDLAALLDNESYSTAVTIEEEEYRKNLGPTGSTNTGFLDNNSTLAAYCTENGVDTTLLAEKMFKKFASEVTFDGYYTIASTINGQSAMNNASYALAYPPASSSTGTSAGHNEGREIGITGGELDVYFLRVYNRILNEEEKMQNHLVDIARFYRLDLSGYRSLSDAKRAEFALAFADVTLDWDENDDAYLANKTKYMAEFADTFAELYYEKTSGDADYNRIMDLAIYYNLDVTAFLWMSDAMRTAFYTLTSDWSEAASVTCKEMQAIFDAAVLSMEPAAQTPMDPYTLYVTDGLLARLDYFSAVSEDGTEASATLTSGTLLAVPTGNSYYKSDLLKNFNLSANNTSTVPVLGDGYLGLYTEDGTATPAPLTIQVLDFSNQPYFQTIPDVTITAVFSATNANINPYLGNLRWNISYSSGIIKASAGSTAQYGYASWGTTKMNVTAFGPQDPVVLSTPTWSMTAAEAAKIYDHTFTIHQEMDAFYETYVAPDTASTVADPTSSVNTTNRYAEGGFTLPEGMDGTSTDHYDGVSIRYNGKLSAVAYLQGREIATRPLNRYINDSLIKFGDGVKTGGKLYAFRMYDRTLSADELAQNHFADLAITEQLDLTRFALLSDAQKQEVYRGMQDRILHEDNAEFFDALVDEIYYQKHAESDADVNAEAFYTCMAYYGLDISEFLSELRDTLRPLVYAEFANAPRTATVPSFIMQDKLNETVAQIANSSTPDYYGGKLLQFSGYQARKLGKVGLRALFDIDEAALAALIDEGYTKIQIGAIMALKNDGTEDRTVKALTVAEGAEGLYETFGTAMKNVTVYRDGAWVGKLLDDTDLTFAYTTIYSDANTEDTVAMQTDMLYRGYVIIEGKEEGEAPYIIYQDCASVSFSDGLSIYDLSSYLKTNRNAAYPTVQKVTNLIDGTSDIFGSVGTTDISDMQLVYQASSPKLGKELAESMQALLGEYLGVSIPVVSDLEADAGKKSVSFYLDDAYTDTWKRGSYRAEVIENELHVHYGNDALAYDLWELLEEDVRKYATTGQIAFASNYVTGGESEAFRVVMFGDSNTANAKVYYALDRYLHASYPETPIEMVNAGISGGTEGGALTAYGELSSRVQRELLDAEPDLAVLCFGVNSVLNGIGYKVEKDQMASYADAMRTQLADKQLSDFLAELKAVADAAHWKDAAGEASFANLTADGRTALYTNVYNYITDAATAASLPTYTSWSLTNYLKAMNNFTTNMTSIAKQATDAGVDLLWASPIPYEEAAYADTTECHFGTYLGFAMLREIAKTYVEEQQATLGDQIRFVDYYDYLSAHSSAQIMGTDRKHFKDERGSYLAFAAYLDALQNGSFFGTAGADVTKSRDTVLSMALAVTGEEASFTEDGTYRADVWDIAWTEGTLSFVYEPHALHLYRDTKWIEAEALEPVLASYNRELLTVAGLTPETSYTVTVRPKGSAEAGTVLATYTGAQLAAGVDLSAHRDGLAMQVQELLLAKRNAVSTLRGMGYVYENDLIKNGYADVYEQRYDEAYLEELDTYIQNLIVNNAGKYLASVAEPFMQNLRNYDNLQDTLGYTDYQIRHLLQEEGCYEVILTPVQ